MSHENTFTQCWEGSELLLPVRRQIAAITVLFADAELQLPVKAAVLQSPSRKNVTHLITKNFAACKN